MISVLIPVYNEENRLSSNLDKIFSYLKTFGQKCEVVIINDGSTDNTSKLLEEYKQKYSLKVLSHEKNLGKGAAIQTGINSSSGGLILFTDIDLSVPIDFLSKFYEASKDADIVIGSREHKSSQVEVKQFFLRELAGLMFTYLTNAILWVGATDFTCGFKLFNREAAEKIFSKQKIKRFAFDAESLFLAKKYGYKIVELPIIWRHDKGTKVRFPQDMIESFISLIMIRVNDLLGKYD
jgi:dolichyl-phosphate beta-glucosyltransferase